VLPPQYLFNMGNLVWKNNFTKEEKDFFRRQSISEKMYNERTWTEEQHERLARLLNGDMAHESSNIDTEQDDGAICVSTTFEEAFAKFLESCPTWSAEGVVLFFNRYSHVPNLKVLRRQRTGLCYMHAPVVLQHYLVSIYNSRHNFENNLKMIDVALFIAKHWKGQPLLRYLLGGEDSKGGGSIEFLKQINYHIEDFSYEPFIILDPIHFRSKVDEKCEYLMTRLIEVPMLVSNFEVDENFARGGISFLDQRILASKTEKPNGRHAMLLIGIRRDQKYGWVFLLQNWWKTRFFIEVSAKYMSLSGAFIVEIYSEIPDIPKDFPVVYASYVETSADMSERMDEI
jgi:hypothetical protein